VGCAGARVVAVIVDTELFAAAFSKRRFMAATSKHSVFGNPERRVKGVVGGGGSDGPKPESGFQKSSRALVLSACSSRPSISTRSLETQKSQTIHLYAELRDTKVTDRAAGL
jgi:hypothetical protein